MPLDISENVVRAICSDKFDQNTGEISPSLFATSKGNVSVSRLKLRPIDQQWISFDQRVAKPPERTVVLLGEINVGLLQDIGLSMPDSPILLTVEEDPDFTIPDSPDFAHALIPQRITRGLANKIIQKLYLHRRE